MGDMLTGIRIIRVEDGLGMTRKVSVIFGPHYYLEITDINGKVKFNLGATHHGFSVDASEVGKGLENIIDLAISKFPSLSVDQGPSIL